VLHLLNKSAFIILLEIADSLRMFCIIVSLYIYIYIYIYIDTGNEEEEYQDYPDP
jgi:hypothetical protein